MESTAFFEKKLSLTPSNFNEVKSSSIENILLNKAKEMVENKCSEQGFVLPGSIKLLSRSMGYFEAARFTGDAIYYVKLEGKVVYPADGVRVIGEVIRKNKMGLYVNYNNAIRIQVPRDLHIGNQEYDAVEIGDNVLIELKRSKFSINDTFILASGVFITNNESKFNGDNNVDSEVDSGEEDESDEDEVKDEDKDEDEDEDESESETESESEIESESESNQSSNTNVTSVQTSSNTNISSIQSSLNEETESEESEEDEAHNDSDFESVADDGLEEDRPVAEPPVEEKKLA